MARRHKVDFGVKRKPDYRSLTLYVPSWIDGVDGTKNKLVCVGCGKIIVMNRVYHIQLCEDCRNRIFHLVVLPLHEHGRFSVTGAFRNRGQF